MLITRPNAIKVCVCDCCCIDYQSQLDWDKIRPAEKEHHSPVHPSDLGENDSPVQKWGNRAAGLSFTGFLLALYPSPPQTTASQGLSLNRSQYGGCSTKYNTPAGTQVVYRRSEGERVVFPESSRHRTHARAVA
jgi:hypothetical protein